MIAVEIPGELLELYPAAKEAILFFETHEGKISPETITELRDSLDHLMLAFSNNMDKDRYNAEINGAIEHLRRASIEPLEYTVETRLADIYSRYKFRNIYRILFVPFARNKTYSSLMTQIRGEILNGRNCKNIGKWKEGVEHFKRSYSLSVQLEDLTPGKEIFYGRLFAIVLAIIFFFLGTLIG